MDVTIMPILKRSLSLLAILSVVAAVTAATTPREPASALTLTASLSGREITVMRGTEAVKTYLVAVGADKHPTPAGTFMIKKIVWNPKWVPPAEKWAKGKKAKAPGHPDNPMKLVKLFFQEPDYYIHGTSAVETLGQAASHGCLRMEPNEAAEVALMVMENGGVARDWDWVKGLLHVGETRTVTLKQPATLSITP